MNTTLIQKYDTARAKMLRRQKVRSVISWAFTVLMLLALVYGWLALTAMDANAEADAQLHAEAQIKTRLLDIFPDPVIAAYKKEHGHE